MLVTNIWKIFAAKGRRNPDADLHILVKPTRRRDDVGYVAFKHIYVDCYHKLYFIPSAVNIRVDAKERGLASGRKFPLARAGRLLRSERCGMFAGLIFTTKPSFLGPENVAKCRDGRERPNTN
jgi:hypothetical protein